MAGEASLEDSEGVAGLRELVLEHDDPTRGGQGHAFVDDLTGTCGQVEVVPGVAAVPAAGTPRGEEPAAA